MPEHNLDTDAGTQQGWSSAPRTPEQQEYTASYRAIATQEGVKVYNGTGCLSVERAMSFDVMDPAFSSVDMLASAILSETLLCIGKEFARRGEDVMDLEGRARLHVDNPLATLAVCGIEGTPRVGGIEVSLYLFTFLDENEASALIDDALSRAVLYQSLQAALPIEMRISFAQ